MSSRFKPVLKILSIVLGAGITALLLWRLRADWGKFRDLDISLRAWPLAASGVCFAAGFCALVEGWRSLVRALGFRVGYGAAFRVVVRASLGRYIPGKVWAAAGLVYLGRGFGVPVKAGSAAAALSTVLLVLTGALVAFYRLGSSLPPLVRLGVSALGVVFLLLLLHPRVWGLGGRFLSRLVTPPPCRWRDLLAPLPFYFLFWLGMGVGFVFAVASLVGEFPPSPGGLVSSYALAYAGGVLAIFVPGGLGVREGLLAVSLAGLCPEGSPLPVAAGIFSRVWATALEGILFAVTFIPLVRRRDGVDSPPPVPDNGPGLSDRHSWPE